MQNLHISLSSLPERARFRWVCAMARKLLSMELNLHLDISAFRAKVMLSNVIRKDLICLDIKSRDKLGALKEMLDMLEGIDHSFLKIRLFQNLLNREGLESTAIGRGVALPHCRTNLVDFPIVMIGWSRKGVDFESPDGKPVHLIIMVLVPQSSNVPWLDLIGDIMRVIRNDTFIRAVSAARTPEEVLQAVSDIEQGKAQPDPRKIHDHTA